MKENKSILFVDDEEEILEVLVELFSDDGYELHTATKAEEALQIIDAHTVDFVLSDMKLPDGNGKDLLNTIHNKKPETVRVLTSGYLDVQFGQVNINETDGMMYLSKPWDMLTLKRLVSDQLG